MAAFSFSYTRFRCLEIDVIETQIKRLRLADRRRVEEFHEGAVSEPDRILKRRYKEELLHLPDGEDVVGEFPRDLRERQISGWVAFDDPRFLEELPEGQDRRQDVGPRLRRKRLPATTGPGGQNRLVPRDMERRESLERLKPLGPNPLNEVLRVEEVTLDGPRRIGPAPHPFDK